MAIDFPTSPTTGDLYTLGSRRWRYNGTAWASFGFYSRLPTVEPDVPEAGDMYFDTEDDLALVYDGSGWVAMNAAILG